MARLGRGHPVQPRIRGKAPGPRVVVHQIAASGGDYTSLAAWEAAQQRNLVAANEIAVAECQSFVDAATTIAGWTTSASCYVHVRAAPGHGVAGPYWDTSKYRISSDTNGCITAQINHVKFTGLYLHFTNPRWYNAGGIVWGASASGARIEIDSCYFRNADAGGQQSNGTAGFSLGDLTYAKTSIVRNCISFGGSRGVTLTWVPAEADQTIMLYNNLVSGGETGEGGVGYWLDTQLGCTERIINCVSVNHYNADFWATGNADTVLRSNNASSDATAWGTSPQLNIPITQFINAADGDFRIHHDDAVLGALGTSLAADTYAPFSTDISGYTRVGTWDIGPCAAPLLVTHQVAASGGDYTSLSAWEAAQQRNLVTVNEVARAECQAFEDTTRVEINGWTTGTTQYIDVRAVNSHGGAWSTSAYRLAVTNGLWGNALGMHEDFVRVRGLQVLSNLTTSGVQYGSTLAVIDLDFDPTRVQFDGCIFRLDVPADAAPIEIGIVASATARNVRYANCLFLGGSAFDIPYAVGRDVSSGSEQWYYNCTFARVQRVFLNVVSDLILKNCLYSASGVSSPLGFSSGTYNAACTNNASTQASGVPGANARNAQTFAFVGAATGDYRLSLDDAGAQSFGTSLSADASLSVSTDIASNPRVGAWDIGASSAPGLAQSYIAASGGPWTNRANDWGTTDHNSLVVDDRVLTTALTGVTATWLHATTDHGALAVAYRPLNDTATITQVGGVTANRTNLNTSLSLSPVTVAVGDLLVVTVATYPDVLAAGAITDSAGNTYTLAAGVDTANGAENHLVEYWSIATTAVSLTVTVAGPITYRTVRFDAYHSTVGWAVAPVDTFATSSYSGTNPISPAITTTASKTLVRISVTDDTSTATYTPPSADYTSLSAWEAAQQRNLTLTTEHEVAEAECQAFTDTAAGVTIDGWTTDAQRFIRVKAAAGAEATVPVTASCYKLSINGTVYSVNEAYTRTERIVAECTSATGIRMSFRFGVPSPGGGSRFVGCVALGPNQPLAGFYTACDGGLPTYLINCVAVGVGGVGAGFVHEGGTGTAHMFNCTSIGWNVGFDKNFGTAALKNCLAHGATSTDFEGTWGAGTEYNASQDATAPGTNNRVNQTFSFVNAAGGDYTLSRDDRAAHRFGTNLSADPTYPFATSLNGVARTASWDIGATETLAGLLASGGSFVETGTDATLTFGGGAGDTRTLNHTAGVNADITLGAVFVVAADVNPTVTATYDGTAMTAVNESNDAGNDYHLELFSIQPTTAPQVVFSSTTTDGLIKAMVAVSYDEVPATAGIRSSVTATGTNDSPTATITDVTLNDKVVAFISWYGTGGIVADNASGEYLVTHTSAGNHNLAVIEAPGTNTTVVINPILSSAAPWQMVVAAVKSTAASGATLTAEAGTYVVTGTDASLKRGALVAAQTESYVFAGTAASLEKGFVVAAETGTVAVTGTDASFRRGFALAAETAAHAVTGTDATLRKTYSVGADSTAYALTGTDAGVEKGFAVAADTVAYVLTGTAANLERGTMLTAEAGAYAWTGTAASLEKGFALVADSGAYAVTGTDATLIGPAGILNAESGAVVVTGAQANLERGARLVADTVAYALTGTAAGLSKGFTVVADTAAYTLTGTDATLRKTGRIVADTAAYAVTGTEANLVRASRVTADTGALALTGTAASLEKGFKVIADTATYVLTGTDALLLGPPGVLNAESGAIVVTGTQANLERGARLVADTVAYAITGTAASLEKGFALAADTVAYAVTGTAANLERGAAVAADSGTYAVTGTDATLEKGSVVAADTVAYAVTGTAASLEKGFTVIADSGAYAVAGTDATSLRGRVLVAETVLYTWTGSEAILSTSPTLNAEAGTFVVATPQTTLRKAYRMVADSVAYTSTGTAASLEKGFEVAGGAGAYVLTGTAANLERGTRVGADAASYVLTGSSTTLLVGRRIGADSGTYVFTGSDASLGSNPTLNAESAAYAITGTAATLLRTIRMAAEAGAYALAGTAANLEQGYEVAADTGACTMTGSDATLKKGFYILAQTTTVAVTGTAANTLANRRVGADTGAYVESGTAASLEKGYRLNGEATSYTVTGTDADKRKQYMLEAAPVTWTVDAPIATNLLSTRILRADTDDYLLVGEEVYLGPVKSWTLDAEPGDVDYTGMPAGLVYTPYAILDLGTFELYETLDTVGTVTIAPQDEYVLKAVPPAPIQLVGGTIIAPDQTITLIVSDPKARTLTKALKAVNLVIVG